MQQNIHLADLQSRAFSSSRHKTTNFITTEEDKGKQEVTTVAATKPVSVWLD